MKKILTIAALAGVASLSHGQGLVSFANSATPITKISVNNGTINSPSVALIPATAGQYYFALFVAPSTTAATGSYLEAPGTAYTGTEDPTANGFALATSSTYAPGGFTAANIASAGRIATLAAQLDSLGDAEIGNAVAGAPGDTADFIVVGWSANLGSTWSAVQSTIDSGVTPAGSFVGESDVAQLLVGGGTTPVPVVFAGASPNAQGFVLEPTPTPEPATFALCGLGAAALVIFRRRK